MKNEKDNNNKQINVIHDKVTASVTAAQIINNNKVDIDIRPTTTASRMRSSPSRRIRKKNVTISHPNSSANIVPQEYITTNHMKINRNKKDDELEFNDKLDFDIQQLIPHNLNDEDIGQNESIISSKEDETNETIVDRTTISNSTDNINEELIRQKFSPNEMTHNIINNKISNNNIDKELSRKIHIPDAINHKSYANFDHKVAKSIPQEHVPPKKSALPTNKKPLSSIKKQTHKKLPLKTKKKNETTKKDSKPNTKKSKEVKQDSIAKRLKPRRSKAGTKCYANPFQIQKQFHLLETLIDDFEGKFDTCKIQNSLANDIQSFDDKMLSTFQIQQNNIMNYMFGVQDQKVRLKRQRLPHIIFSVDGSNKARRKISSSSSNHHNVENNLNTSTKSITSIRNRSNDMAQLEPTQQRNNHNSIPMIPNLPSMLSVKHTPTQIKQPQEQQQRRINRVSLDREITAENNTIINSNNNSHSSPINKRKQQSQPTNSLLLHDILPFQQQHQQLNQYALSAANALHMHQLQNQQFANYIHDSNNSSNNSTSTAAATYANVSTATTSNNDTNHPTNSMFYNNFKTNDANASTNTNAAYLYSSFR